MTSTAAKEELLVVHSPNKQRVEHTRMSEFLPEALRLLSHILQQIIITFPATTTKN